jgi:hypothetical protein
MILVSWLVAHWKVLFAAVVAIAFFSYRARRVAHTSTKESEEAEGPQMQHSEPISLGEQQQRAAPSTQFTTAGDTSSPQATSTADHSNGGDASHPNTDEHQSTSGEAAQTQTEEDVNTTLDDITSLFANRSPKHALHGLSDAVRNVATGVGLGVASVAAGTYSGAKEGGWAGAAKGFGAGACGLVGFTGYGLYSGARQVLRGVGNTPTAVSEVNKGEAYWDSNTQKWVRVNLAQDFETLSQSDGDILAEARKAYTKAEQDGTLPAMAASAQKQQQQQQQEQQQQGQQQGQQHEQAGPAADHATGCAPQGEGGATTPADDPCAEPSDYYAFLGVEKTATTAEIRKAYTHKALEMHPDKNPNDPYATVLFQNLNKVYSVLSNEDSRAAYDRYGTVDPQSVPEMANNPMKEMLGAAFLEPLVGQLHFFLVFEGGILLTEEMQRELHRRRRLRVAKNLVSWIDNGAAGMEAARLVLRDAVSTALGPVLVSYVAEQYHLSSRQHLHSNSWAREVDSWYSSWAMSASSLWHWTTMSARTARRAFFDKNIGEEDVLHVLAVANESDVRRIALQACRFALYDTSVTLEKRRERAVQLEKLSELAMAEVRREIAARESAAAEAQAAAAAAEAEGHGTSPQQEGKAASPPS